MLEHSISNWNLNVKSQAKKKRNKMEVDDVKEGDKMKRWRWKQTKAKLD